MATSDQAAHPVTQQHVVLALPGMEAVEVRRGVTYRHTAVARLGMDLYYPPATAREHPLPAVVFVTGYADPGAEQMLGRKLKDWAAYGDWARLVACVGLVAITYENEDPLADATRVLAYVREHAAALGVDANRIGMWSASGNVPNALAQLTCSDAIACAALLYGYTLDLDGSTAVAEAAGRWGFVDAMADRPLESLSPVPLMLVRAGRDELPGLNETMSCFVDHAIHHGLPVTLVNHADAPHGFDIADDSDASRAVVRHVLAYLKSHLSP